MILNPIVSFTPGGRIKFTIKPDGTLLIEKTEQEKAPVEFNQDEQSYFLDFFLRYMTEMERRSQYAAWLQQQGGHTHE